MEALRLAMRFIKLSLCVNVELESNGVGAKVIAVGVNQFRPGSNINCKCWRGFTFPCHMQIKLNRISICFY